MKERLLAEADLETILNVYELSLHDENVLNSLTVCALVDKELRTRICNTLVKIENGCTAHQAYIELIK